MLKRVLSENLLVILQTKGMTWNTFPLKEIAYLGSSTTPI